MRKGSKKEIKVIHNINDVNSDFLEVKDLITYLGICQKVAYELVKSETFPSFRIGGRYKVGKGDLIKWMENQNKCKGEIIMKSAKEIMSETSPNELGLALIYIEHERQLCDNMRTRNDVEIARQEGIMHGILTTAKLLGLDNFYGKTLTNLRYAINNEKGEREAVCGEKNSNT